MTKEERINEAWELYVTENGGKVPTITSWWELPPATQKEYLDRVPVNRITANDLRDWFGEVMPSSVFDFLFKEAPPEMPLHEVHERVRQMALDFRSPPSLSEQAFALLQAVKKNGNLAPALMNEINAWESRFYIWRREENAKSKGT
jgi:hypothetical protein